MPASLNLGGKLVPNFMTEDTRPPANNSYDELPYPSIAQSESHPDRLATLATLFGMTPPLVDTCRVMELGCSDGGNLMAMAYGLPEAEFLGLDFSAREVAAGQERIAQLGLKNITLRHMDILQAGPELGQFDYILACGVYSWVPPQIQDKMLELCRQLLSPNGVAYINYNTYPGWFMRGIVRHMLLYHTRGIAIASQRVGEARTLLDFMTKASEVTMSKYALLDNDRSAYSAIMRHENAILNLHKDTYLYHEHLEEYNEPLYFHEFIQRARQHGLQFLAEGEYAISELDNLPLEISQTVRQLTGDLIQQQQYLDFVVNRTFRQTLLCHEAINLRRPPAPDQLSAFSVASLLLPESEKPDLRSTGAEKFVSPRGMKLTASNAVAKTALMYLSEIWPQAIQFDELLAVARARLNPDAPPVYSAERLAHDARTVAELLLRSFASDLVELHVRPARFVTQISERPALSPLARHQARLGRNVINLRHETITVEDEITYRLLPFVDGQHDRAALLNQLVQMTRSGELVVQTENGRPLKEGAKIEANLAAALEQALRKLANAALLIA